MKSASLRESVTIQQRTLGTADTYAEQARSWTDVETLRASVRQAGSSTSLAGRLLVAEATHMVVMRYTANFGNDGTWRLKWSDNGTIRYLKPTSVEPDERKRQLTCLCKEVA
jgi:head-tail adaptor